MNLPTARAAAAQVAVLAWAMVLVGVWLAVDPRTPDLAAQVYRANLFGQLGLVVWDQRWYAGHMMPAYSLISPAAGALLGVRGLGALSVLASTLLFERLARSLYGQAGGWGAALFVVSAVGDVWSGRVTFALGVALALASALALRHGRLGWAALLAALCAAGSPAAGALLGLVALTVALSERSARALLAMALPAAAVVGVLVGLFPEGGYEPFPFLSFAMTVLVSVAFVCALPRDSRTLRVGAGVYVLACVGCLAIDTPIGSNIERYGVLLAGPLLLCARLAARRGHAVAADAAVVRSATAGTTAASSAAGSTTAASTSAVSSAARVEERFGVSVLAVAALCLSTVWVVWGPVRETVAVAGSEATSASYYVPVERFLERNAAGPVRVEVPLTRSHWEAALLAPSVSLARGWEKQLDTRYDGVLLRPGLTAASYRRWLDEQGVLYVALPDVPLDPSSAREGPLIEAGLPYLREVFHSKHWRIYEVLDPTPLVSGGARLLALGHDSFTLRAARTGSFVVRVHYTRYWTPTRGGGCVTRAPGGWTEVRVRAAGAVTVAARFSLGRALGVEGSCSA